MEGHAQLTNLETTHANVVQDILVQNARVSLLRMIAFHVLHFFLAFRNPLVLFI